jgi:hypothetical protein
MLDVPRIRDAYKLKQFLSSELSNLSPPIQLEADLYILADFGALMASGTQDSDFPAAFG